MSRVAVLLVVVAVHLGLIAVFTASRKLHWKIEEEEQAMTVVFLSEMPSRWAVSRSNPASEATRGPDGPGKDAPKRAAFPSQTPFDAAAITSRSSEFEPRPPSASIDWSKEAEFAASRQIDSLERSRTRGGGFAPPAVNLKTPLTPKPEFGWSHVQTHRIESLPPGGTLLWINERCALVVNGGLLPICNLGKTEARGDLFEHMRDAPELGDWKQLCASFGKDR